MEYFWKFMIQPFFDWKLNWQSSKFPEMANKNSKDNQMMMGIEAFLLGREWIIKPNENESLSVGEFYNTIDEIHQEKYHKTGTKAWDNDETKTEFSEKIRKRYEPYFKLLNSTFEFDFSFKQKISSDYERKYNAIYKIAKYILNELCLKYNDESLQIILKQWKKPADFPTFLICIRYAVEFGFPIEFKYTKLMSTKIESRKIYPYLITLTENNLGLIGYDTKDKTTKSFLLSRISEPRMNFLSDYYKASTSEIKPPKFDYNLYLSTDPNARFQKKERKYLIRMAKNNFDLLQHSKTLKFKEISSEIAFVTIEIVTYNEWDVFDLLFNYGTYAQLLSPSDAVERFNEKLISLLNHYSIDSRTKKKSR
jgi:predicted DNA-binding transcriptional regulator YafY